VGTSHGSATAFELGALNALVRTSSSRSIHRHDVKAGSGMPGQLRVEVVSKRKLVAKATITSDNMGKIVRVLRRRSVRHSTMSQNTHRALRQPTTLAA
jgi:hypothetical protein